MIIYRMIKKVFLFFDSIVREIMSLFSQEVKEIIKEFESQITQNNILQKNASSLLEKVRDPQRLQEFEKKLVYDKSKLVDSYRVQADRFKAVNSRFQDSVRYVKLNGTIKSKWFTLRNTLEVLKKTLDYIESGILERATYKESEEIVKQIESQMNEAHILHQEASTLLKEARILKESEAFKKQLEEKQVSLVDKFEFYKSVHAILKAKFKDLSSPENSNKLDMEKINKAYLNLKDKNQGLNDIVEYVKSVLSARSLHIEAQNIKRYIEDISSTLQSIRDKINSSRFEWWTNGEFDSALDTISSKISDVSSSNKAFNESVKAMGDNIFVSSVAQELRQELFGLTVAIATLQTKADDANSELLKKDFGYNFSRAGKDIRAGIQSAISYTGELVEKALNALGNFVSPILTGVIDKFLPGS